MPARLPQPRTSSRRAAFSLVELLVVIAIMAILAGISYALLGQSGAAAREAATKAGMRRKLRNLGRDSSIISRGDHS